MTTLYDVAIASPVHQILLSSGPLDRIPTEKIEHTEAIFNGVYTLWTEDSIVELLKTNFEPKVLDAYNSIKPLAFKADLARYCIVYVYGGWYLDVLASIVNPELLKYIKNDRQGIIFRDIPLNDNPLVISNTVFWFKDPKNKVLKKLIDRVVFNILSRNYGNHPHSVSGPVAFGAEVAANQLNAATYDFAIGTSLMIDNRISHCFSWTGIPDTQIFSQRRAMNEEFEDLVPTGYETSSTYFKMWENREIFN